MEGGPFSPIAAPAAAKYAPRVGGWQAVPMVGASGTLAMTASRLYFVSASFAPGQVDRIALRTTTGGGAGSVIRVGIYAPTADGLPGTLLADLGTQVSTGTGTLEWTTTAGVNGLVMLAAAAQVGTAPTIAGLSGADGVRSNSGSLYFSSSGLNVFSNGVSGYSQDSVTGALPATATPVADGGSMPVFGIRWA